MGMRFVAASPCYNNFCMIDSNDIIARFYSTGSPLHQVLTIHSQQVASLAQHIAQRLIAAGTPVDEQFVVEAAMLHDIGIIGVDAPGIHCYGSEPYIKHGILGRNMLDQLGLYRHALVCERHTGAGITAAEVVAQQLPLPHRDFLPLSIEEKIVCYADKFFSKSHLAEPPRTVARIEQSLARFGASSVARFAQLHQLLSTQ